jgi:hypothetical protein
MSGPVHRHVAETSGSIAHPKGEVVMSNEVENSKIEAVPAKPDPVVRSLLDTAQVGKRCPDDFLTPREMVGYLRANEEEPGSIPAEVLAHTDACPVCGPTWKFIATTDPVLRKFRQERVELIIQTVVQRENYLSEPISPEEREHHIGQVEQDLSRIRSNSSPTDAVWQTILTKEEISVDQVFEIISGIWEIEDDQTRYIRAKELATIFARRVRLDQLQRKIDLDFLGKLMAEESAVIDLSSGAWGVSREAAVVFVASLPHVGFFHPPVLEKTESGIFFHLARFKSLMPEFIAVGAKFEPSPKSTATATR